GAGGDVEACREAAVDTMGRCHTFLYLHRIDEMRRSGRMSAAATLMSTTLATRPILSIAQGKFEIAAKTRTQSKGMAKLAEIACAVAGGKPADVWLQQYEAREAATGLKKTLLAELPEGSSVTVLPQDAALAIHSGPGSLALSIKVDPSAVPPQETAQATGKHKNTTKGMDFLSLLKNDPKPAADIADAAAGDGAAATGTGSPADGQHGD
ncbi:DegV family protein, partial [Corynebacterium mendelii]|uniref:DegV family protein n=1 Tax=Corynebacterium mendelii TaxID=2765362 RepID=UPI001F5C1F52